MQALTPEYASPEQLQRRQDHHGQRRVLARRPALSPAHRPPPLRAWSRAPSRNCGITCRIVRRAAPAPWCARSMPDVDPGIGQRSPRTRPDRLERQLAGDIDNILLMALRKEPERRYGSVEQFANDLRRHLQGHPVTARPDTIRYRTGKFIRRHRTGVRRRRPAGDHPGGRHRHHVVAVARGQSRARSAPSTASRRCAAWPTRCSSNCTTPSPPCPAPPTPANSWSTARSATWMAWPPNRAATTGCSANAPWPTSASATCSGCLRGPTWDAPPRPRQLHQGARNRKQARRARSRQPHLQTRPGGHLQQHLPVQQSSGHFRESLDACLNAERIQQARLAADPDQSAAARRLRRYVSEHRRRVFQSRRLGAYARTTRARAE